MPRSKKKKGPVKHPIGSPNWQPSHEYSTTIASLMSKERELMITRAINSGKRHMVNQTWDLVIALSWLSSLTTMKGNALQTSSHFQLTHIGKYGSQTWQTEQ